MKKRLSIILVVLIALGGAVACAIQTLGSREVNELPQSQAQQNVLPREIEGAVQSLAQVDLFTEVQRAPLTELEGPFIELSDATPPASALPLAEAQLLYGWVAPNGNWSSLTGTYAELIYYYDEFSQLPQSGAHLVAWKLGNDVKRIEALLALSPQEQLNQSYYAVNPVTGRYFESFSSGEWTPGAVHFEMLKDTQGFKQGYEPLPGDLDEQESCKYAFRLTVHSATSSQVLGSKTLYTVLRDH